jgi:hypothetical protein
LGCGATWIGDKFEEQIQGVSVYALYGLTPAEIQRVEGAAK